MIASGVFLLFIISIELHTHRGWRFGDNMPNDSGVIPLSFLLLAGLGAIASVIQPFQTSGLMITVLSFLTVIGFTCVIYYITGPTHRISVRLGSLIMTRVFTILVATIAVQHVVN